MPPRPSKGTPRVEQNGVSRAESTSTPPLTPEQRKALAGQSFKPIQCPYCGGSRPEVVATCGDVRYYRCRKCNLDEGRDGTGFKVPVVKAIPSARPETRGR